MTATLALSLLILLDGIGARVMTPKDVLPTVDIPVVVVVWIYNGLNANDMASRTTDSEFSLSNNINSIQRMESKTLPGTAVERIFFQQDVGIDLAITQIVSATNAIRANIPPVSNTTLRDEAMSVAFPQPCWLPHVRSSPNGEGP